MSACWNICNSIFLSFIIIVRSLEDTIQKGEGEERFVDRFPRSDFRIITTIYEHAGMRLINSRRPRTLIIGKRLFSNILNTYRASYRSAEEIRKCAENK